MPRAKRIDQKKSQAISAPSPSVDTQDMFPEICVSGAARGVRGKTKVGETPTFQSANTAHSTDGIDEKGVGVSDAPSMPHGVGSTDAIICGRDRLEIVRLALDVYGRDVAQALWREFGLPMPPPPPRRQRQMSEGQKQVMTFIEECIIPDPLWEATSSDLYVHYKRWVAPYGDAPLDQSAFGRYLTKCGCRRRRSNGSIYVGVRLRGDP